ncbi:MAG: limonene-1,2-epoxide hydrolase family protein [Pseudomonadota bacterium]
MKNEAIVRGFVDTMNELDWEGVYAALTPDVVVHNMPMPPLYGVDAVRSFFDAVPPITQCDWKILHISVAGDLVFNERLDNFVMAGQAVSLPVMGLFEITGGKIKTWRDYFDLKDFERQLGQPLG